MSNNINNNNTNPNQEVFNINYQKRKNIELFQSLEKIANVSKLQNYIPIYSRFFSLNLQNYNSINLNNKWFISNVYSLYEDDDDYADGDEDCSDNEDKQGKSEDDDITEDNYINQCLYNCRIKNTLNQKSKDKVVFMKFAPLLDPIKFMTGKYHVIDNNQLNENTNLYNLPSIEENPDTTTNNTPNNKNKVHSKLLNINNSAYVDSFFVYLSSTLLHNTNFIHGLDYYGSFLGIKKNYTFNICDDLDYLVQSDYFNKNKNLLFEVDDENYDYESNNQYSSKNLKKLVICEQSNDDDEKIVLDLAVDDINNTMQVLDDIFIDNSSGDNGDKCDDCEIDLQEISLDNNIINLPFEKTNTSLRSSSCCSSRTSYTSDASEKSSSIKIHELIETDGENGENNNQCEECDTYDEIPELINAEDINNLNNKDNVDDCDNDTEYTSYDSESEYIEARIPEFPVELICMESCENTFDDLIASNELSEEEWLSAFMQIIMILLTYQRTFSFTHNDLHTNNVMYNHTDKKYIYYCYKNQYYKVPTFGRLFKIIDFGRAIYKYKGNLFCSDSFENGGDAATQYNTEPYFNDKKPRIDPNYSFDICRLACSIFDYLVEDITNVKYLENNNPIVKLIVEWCSDDKGINLLYKANGEDRYPEFKLYKMIARCSHNHTPENQLTRPEFSKFVVPFNTISKMKGLIENLINIDKTPILSK